MKKLLIFLFLVTSIIVKSQTHYNPSLAIPANNAIGFAQATPGDARSMFYDAVLFKFRAYQTTTEANLYLYLSKYRIGYFPIYIQVGGALQPDGSFVGGVLRRYWYRDGVADGNLVEDMTVSTLTDSLFVIRGLIPPQVNLSAGTGITITGSYPNLTITSTLVSGLTAGYMPVSIGAAGFANSIAQANSTTVAIDGKIVAGAGLLGTNASYFQLNTRGNPLVTGIWSSEYERAGASKYSQSLWNSTDTSTFSVWAGVNRLLFLRKGGTTPFIGTASTRPSSPITGEFYYDTDSSNYVYYTGIDWAKFAGAGGGGGTMTFWTVGYGILSSGGANVANAQIGSADTGKLASVLRLVKLEDSISANFAHGPFSNGFVPVSSSGSLMTNSIIQTNGSSTSTNGIVNVGIIHGQLGYVALNDTTSGNPTGYLGVEKFAAPGTVGSLRSLILRTTDDSSRIRVRIGSKESALFGSTYFRAFVGVASDRPGSPAAGMIYFDTDSLSYVQYTGSAWVAIGKNRAINGLTVDGSNFVTLGGSLNQSTSVSTNGQTFQLGNIATNYNSLFLNDSIFLWRVKNGTDTAFINMRSSAVSGSGSIILGIGKSATIGTSISLSPSGNTTITSLSGGNSNSFNITPTTIGSTTLGGSGSGKVALVDASGNFSALAATGNNGKILGVVTNLSTFVDPIAYLDTTITGFATKAYVGSTVNGATISTTIANIRALTVAPTGALYTTDARQEGLWQYDASDASSSDNTGTILVDAANHRYKRKFSGAINVLWFGVLNDSTGNQATGIANANVAANNNTLYFPSGKYRITSPIVTSLSNVKWVGEDSTSIIVGNLDSLIRFTNIWNSSIKYMGFLSTKSSAGQSGAGLVYTNKADIRYFNFEHNWMSAPSANTDGLAFNTNIGDSTVTQHVMQHIFIRYNKFISIGRVAVDIFNRKFTSDAYARAADIHVDYNYADSLGTQGNFGMLVSFDGAGQFCSVNYNYLKNGLSTGIELQAYNGSQIIGNVVEYTTRSFVPYSIDPQTNPVYNLTVAYNKSTGPNTYWNVFNCNDSKFFGNTVYGSMNTVNNDGIMYLIGSSNNTFTSDSYTSTASGALKIASQPTAGTYFNKPSKNNKFINCIFTSLSGNSLRALISFDSSLTTNNIIMNCQFYKSTDSAYFRQFASAATNVVIDNYRDQVYDGYAYSKAEINTILANDSPFTYINDGAGLALDSLSESGDTLHMRTVLGDLNHFWSNSGGAAKVSQGNSTLVGDSNYTALSTDYYIVLPNPSTPRTFTLPDASTMPEKELVLLPKASSAASWVLSGKWVQVNVLGASSPYTEGFVNGNIGALGSVRLKSMNDAGVWRWFQTQ